MKTSTLDVQVDRNIDAELFSIGERYEDDIDRQHETAAQVVDKMQPVSFLRRLLGILFPLLDASKKHE